MTQCLQCEAKIDESMSFCESCGTKLDWSEITNALQPNDDATIQTAESSTEEKNDEPSNERADDAQNPELPIAEVDEIVKKEAVSEATEQLLQEEIPPVISPTKTKPKPEKKPVDRTKIMLSSTIGVLLIAVATVFTLSFLALPSAQKWLDNANEAFLAGDKEAFYNAFSKPEPIVATSDTFYEELASDWPNIVAQMQRAIDQETPFSTFQTTEGRDILELTVVKKWGMTDVTVRYLPAEVTIVAAKKHQTIVLPNMELFSVHDNEQFTIYAVPGSYTVELLYKGEHTKNMIILQSSASKTHVLGAAR
ncbi:zinc ribbon domain-containing protein [Caryophanon latum]|uniref:Zinc-ribbon domain-containing protein n=1 Tax=Caryophanon latum TaxID=33977 RepID=A0A1C0YTN8_9BACL|nr:zinc ribbon domain-containing protein [Caryophanon latum]OCS90519.1 hypothetical protein A6K76_11690 [Caryophanon latum]